VLGRTGRLIAVAFVLGAAFGTASHTARAAGDLGGYDLRARAPALEVTVDSDLIPVPAHPVLDATIPEATSTLQSGLGHGLASVFWPGDLGGHAGSAIQQLGQLCSSMLPITLPNVPTQCTPVPQALKDNARSLNDPVKAETFAPGGPADDVYTFTPPMPGVVMKSHADPHLVDSTAGFASFGAPGLGSLGSVTSHSVTTAAATTAGSEATSEIFNVVLAGGLVTIDHIKSTAKETTDGSTATSAGNTVLSGLRVGGVPASIDTNGLQVGALSAVANKALNTLGLEIKLTTPDVVHDGAKGSFTAPVLTISYRDDQNALEAAAIALGQKLTTGPLKQLTQSLQQLALGPQAKVTVALGGAAVSVDSSPGFGSPDEGAAASASAPEGSIPGTPGFASTAGQTSVEGASFSSPGSVSLRRASRARPATRLAGFLDPFGGLAWGMVAAAVAAAIALAYGLRRYALAVDEAGSAGTSSACPNDLH